MTRGATVVDVGASDGVFTERMSHLVGATGQVHAFEANPGDEPLLEAVRARCPNVSVHITALSDQTGEATLHVPVLHGRRSLGRASLVVPDGRRSVRHEPVPVVVSRLDDALGEARREVTFVKCDVEGHEHAVLLGGVETLREAQPTLLVEIEHRHRDRPVAETFELLQDLGYRGFGIRGRRLLGLADFDLERDQLRFAASLEAADDDVSTDYVHNFVFVPAAAPLPRSLQSRVVR